MCLSKLAIASFIIRYLDRRACKKITGSLSEMWLLPNGIPGRLRVCGHQSDQ
jgi:hypothetical protein